MGKEIKPGAREVSWVPVARLGLTLPSPARHGGCTKERNRRAACPLPGQGEGSGCCRIEVLPVSPTVQKRRKNYTTYQYRRIPCFPPRRSKIRRARDCARNVRPSRAANNDPHPRAPGALALSLSSQGEGLERAQFPVRYDSRRSEAEPS